MALPSPGLNPTGLCPHDGDNANIHSHGVVAVPSALPFVCLLFEEVQFSTKDTSVFQTFFNHADFSSHVYFSNKEEQLCSISCFSTTKPKIEENSL